MGIKDLLGDFDKVGRAVDEQIAAAPESGLKKKGKKRGRWRPPPESARWSDLYSTCKGAILGSVAAAVEVIGTIERGETLHIISDGNWAMEHPIAAAATQFGPVDLWIATWAVNDDAVLRLSEAVRQGFVRRCRAVIDERMKVLRPAALDVMQTALGDGNLGIMACHMKVYCLRQVDGDHGLAIVSSANFTKNPRPEAMVMQADLRAVEFYSGWIERQLDTGRARPYQHTGKLKEELFVPDISRVKSEEAGVGALTSYTPKRRDGVPIMVIFRGVSGSDKRRLAESTGFEILSAADHHVGPDGVYRYERKNDAAAHDECFSRAMAAVGDRRDVAIVNVNARTAEVAPYVMLARSNGYDLEVVHAKCPIWVASARNRHGVSEKEVRRQVRAMEKAPSHWPREITVNTDE